MSNMFRWGAKKNGRGQISEKNLQNSKFTEVVLRDVNFEDVYWQSEATNSYSHKNGSEDIWILRAKADTQHGEKGGHEAVQAAIDAGIYKSRMIKVKNKEGKLVQVEQVNISEEKSSKTRDVTWKDKMRAGGQSSEQEFKQKGMKMLMDGTLAISGEDADDPILKRPAAASSQLAIQDGTVSETPSKKSKTSSTLIKRPAAHSLKKKPAAAEDSSDENINPDKTPLKETALKKLEEMHIEQNEQLNGCL